MSLIKHRPEQYDRKIIAGVIEAKARRLSLWRRNPDGTETKIKDTWGPSASSIIHEAFDKMLAEFEKKNAVEKKYQRVSMNIPMGRLPDKYLRLEAYRKRLYDSFGKKYGTAMELLWTPKQTLLTSLHTPFINVMVFPNDDAGNKQLRRFAKCLQDSLFIQQGQRRGAPSQPLTSPTNLKRARALRKKGMSFPKIVEKLHPERAQTGEREALIKRYQRALQDVPIPQRRPHR